MPVQINFPIYKIDTLIYQIPAGYTLYKNKDSYSVTDKYGEYKLQVYQNTGNIMVVKSLLIHSGYYPVSEYEKFYNFYNQILGIENKTLISFYK